MKAEKKPVILTHGCEEILRAVHFYRYMTALDVANLLYAPGKIRQVREALSTLAGGADFDTDAYLYRFRMPKTEAGNPERIYTLGRAGREFMENELGVRLSWKVRADKGVHLGFSQLMHNLTLTRLLVAGRRQGRESPGLLVAEMKICYELGGQRTKEEGKGLREKASVIPDGWILFEKGKRGTREASFPVMLEIDRGTMFRERFKKHVTDRIEFVRSGAYERMFGTKAVVIAYVTTGATGEEKEGRRRALCAWTMEALKSAKRESWVSVFRFASVSFGKIYESGLFKDAFWYRPDQDKPAGLFT